MLMDEHLGRMAAAYPEETAFEVVDVGALTFAEWDGAANALARRLVDEGIAPDDRVGIHLHPELALQWLVSYAAVHRAGGVAVPMNPRLAPAEVGHVLAHSGAAARRGGRRPGAGGRRGRPGDAPNDRRRHERTRTRRRRSGGSAASPSPTRPRATRARSRSRGPPPTWPTSSTPRAPRGDPRGWRSVTRTPP